MLAIQEGVFQQEIAALDPHVVIFLTGPYYDCVIKRFYPNPKEFELPPFKTRQVMRIGAPDLPTLTFRSYHPGYVHRRGALGWPWYQAIIDQILAKRAK